MRAYTVNNAWVAGEEAYEGKIKLLADLTVVDQSPFDVDPSEIKDLVVAYTIVDGRIVFQRPRTYPRR